MSLTRAEVNQFEREGYVVKPGVYSQEDMGPMKDALIAIVHKEALTLKDGGGLDDIYENEPFQTRLARIRYANPEACKIIYRSIMGKGGGGYSGAAMLPFLRHRLLLSCVESLIGPDIIGSSIYRIRPKLPQWPHGEVPWHQDSGYLLPHCDEYLIVTCWIPLVDANLDNGCLYVLPRLHKVGVIRHYTGGHSGYLEMPRDGIPQSEPLPIEMEAGSVLFMTNLTPHASFVNNSDEVRWSLDVRYQGMDAPNNVDEDPESYTPERAPVTMACAPTEADFVIRDRKAPEREVKTSERFHEIRERYEKARPSSPGRGWTPFSERTRIKRQTSS